MCDVCDEYIICRWSNQRQNNMREYVLLWQQFHVSVWTCAESI